ncbi:MAG TPA: C39 family peptidase [Herpetosiphonaceae bacterium]
MTRNMFPDYVHCIVADADAERWPIQQQGINECGCTAPANALNLLIGERRYDKDQFLREAGLFFQRNLGGSPSPISGWLIKRQGFGTHFGSLRKTDAEVVLRDLIDRRVPVIVELGANQWGPLKIYGQHSVVLVGYSNPYTDASGQQHEEYYVVDAQYPTPIDASAFGLHTNDVDRDGDGVAEPHPGNRTIPRDLFLLDYPTGIYFPVFPTQEEHDRWYREHIRPAAQIPVFGAVVSSLLTGTIDLWRVV